MPKAKHDVSELINGSLDVDNLLDEGAQIEDWLEKNSSPYIKGQ